MYVTRDINKYPYFIGIWAGDTTLICSILGCLTSRFGTFKVDLLPKQFLLHFATIYTFTIFIYDICM